MCGRFVLLTDLSHVVETFQVEKVLVDYLPLPDAYPGRDVFAVIREEGNLLVPLRWGLVPSWARKNAAARPIINARAETLSEKPSFREAFRRRRCLIVADGFYEWEKSPKKSIPHFFRLASGAPFGLAGLYDESPGRDGRPVRAGVVITTAPNELIRPIHERMPAIVSGEDAAAWLEPSPADADSLRSLLHPYPAGVMRGERGVFPTAQGPSGRPDPTP